MKKCLNGITIRCSKNNKLPMDSLSSNGQTFLLKNDGGCGGAHGPCMSTGNLMDQSYCPMSFHIECARRARYHMTLVDETINEINNSYREPFQYLSFGALAGNQFD